MTTHSSVSTLRTLPYVLFEVSWEVCNKVGGIYTVISSRAKTMVERLGDDYVAVGPWLLSQQNVDGDFADEPGHEAFAESCRRLGVPVRVGRWRIPGRPRAILVEFTGLLADKDAYFAGLWERFEVDSLHGGWSYVEPATFGRAAGIVVERWWRDRVAPAGKPAVLFAHEWMAGTALLHAHQNAPAIGTVFTTHATILGRSLGGRGHTPVAGLEGRTPEQAARDVDVTAKHSLEGVTARIADVFTTVSAVTAHEAEVFHRRRATPILPNGLDFDVLDALAGRADRELVERRLRDLAARFLGSPVDDHLVVATSGRYEFHNKGFDVLLEAMGQLDRRPGQPILLFLFVPAGTSGPRFEMLATGAFEGVARRDPSIVSTHHLFELDRDPIQNACARLGLDNAAERRVKVLHLPIYLHQRDGILDLPYESVIRAVDLTCFPSFYEPWGLTPEESLALGVPTITADNAGFGAWMQEQGVTEADGLYVLPRADRDDASVAAELADMIERFADDDLDRDAIARACRAAAAQLQWSRLAPRFLEAFEIARDQAASRVVPEMLQAARWTAPPAEPRPGRAEPRLRTYEVAGTLPKALEDLERLARNYRWDHDAQRLFAELSPERWEAAGGNPVRFLQDLSRNDSEARRGPDFDRRVEAALARLRDALERPIDRASAQARLSRRHPVAYFCAEFGIESTLQIYTGGLGVLAGDHLRAASDLSVPMAGIGLFYHRGYLHQQIGREGDQVWSPALNDPRSHALELQTDDDGKPVEARLRLPGADVVLAIWRAMVGNVPLYLLDADLPVNRPEDRAITHFLYGGDNEMRLRQEIVLGRGGIQVLELLGIEPAVVHVNEGHAAFAPLERVARLVRQSGLTFDEASELVRSSAIFTTHTSISAGHDRFSESLMRRYFYDVESWLGLPWERFFDLGCSQEDPEGFSMTRLALRLCRRVNGVSRIHRDVSRRLLRGAWPGLLPAEVPVHHVTNGVHLESWTSPEIARLLDPKEQAPPGPELARRAAALAPEALWEARQAARRRLLESLRRRVQRAGENRGDPAPLIWRELESLDENALLVGFARRFAAYKRADLLLRDRRRLLEVLSRPDRPVRILYGGKAHPRDGQGQEILKRVAGAAASDELAGKVLFLEDYDIELARLLVQGVDLWLNTPTRGLEASGTSGMKAGMNGVLNLSVADGWWAEAQEGLHGWTVTGGELSEDPVAVDNLDSADVLRLLDLEIAPLFFERDADGVPRRWMERSIRSIAMVAERFGARRMVEEYRDWAYLPSARSWFELRERDFAAARDAVWRQRRLRRGWNQIQVLGVELPLPGTLEIGERIEAVVDLDLGDLSNEDVLVELVLGRPSRAGQLDEARVIALAAEDGLPQPPPAGRRFRADATLENAGRWACGIRLRAREGGEPGLSDLVLWV
ncbi:MAG TPA: alpha-glucan family phosphorylase [Thermoanaerobaculia bacterium]|nr:alpha-glucan family phosphorylase [Thermoanaerobaculia bacterium]